MTDLEKKTDEIFALQSIFDKNLRQFDENQYEILIDFDLVTPLTIEYEDQTSIVEYLPPFSLLVQYHDEYPSHFPPTFVLSCFYFSKSNLQKLCQKLDKYPFVEGEVCVYEWINLIKLEVDRKLIMENKEEEEEEEEGDPRALNGYSSETAKKIFQYLVQYNADQFHKRIQVCSICDNCIRGIDCIRLHRCQHYYCQSCLQDYIRMTLKNGQFGERIHCPQNQCHQALLPTEIRQILRDDQLYERYERLTLQQGLESMDDIVWCPKCQMAVLVDNSDDNLAMCDQCRYIFCKKCKELFHSQTICPKDYIIQQLEKESYSTTVPQSELSFRREQKIQEYDQKVLATIAKVEQRSRTTIEANLAEQKYRQLVIPRSEGQALLESVLNAERMELLNTQPCPKCHVQIEKNGGCSHMYCTRCNHSFLWERQDKPATVKNISLLFKFMKNSEKMEPLQEEVKQATKSANSKISIDNRSAIGSAIVSRVKQCPNKSCKKFIVKVNRDNWIVCDGCRRQFCFLCEQKIVSTDHYVRKCERYTSL
ncbi:unnamed protein product [Adineta ricciae]|uniref:RBR-type E3 ubiquitin transferase n=1 Tax=Adineta ricciae TaxID=249248 RepID=A0A813NN20_ADIRI|nr:unnamed protein product [Adineta ricciae]